MAQSIQIARTVLDTGVTTVANVTVSNATPLAHEVPPIVHAVTCTVDFGDVGGTGSDMALTTVTGQPWVSSTSSKFIPQVCGRPDVSGVDDEDALLDQVRAVVTNIVNGVGFDVVAHAPEGTNGQFLVHVIGV